MSSLRSMSFSILALCLFAIGCVGSPEEDLAGGDLLVPLQPLEGPLGANGMSPIDFWTPSTQEALRSLGQTALVGTGGALVATPLLDTGGGRSVLGYAMRCALSQGTTLSAAGGLAFQGLFGLASGWSGRGLTTSEQRWVTACLLQHLNGLGLGVDIMLEGSHPALVPHPVDDISGFTVKDTTMFGNIFVTGLLTAYACIELDIQLTCGLDLSIHTIERLCGLSPVCGVTFLGLCNLICTDSAAGDPTCSVLPLLGPTYAEAIRTKVIDTDLLSLYPGCDLL